MRQRKKSDLLAAVAALVLVATVVPAASSEKHAPTFFERLFSSRQNTKPVEVKRKSNFSFFNWISAPRKSNVDITYNTADGDPEPYPTIGMGNLGYVPPKALSLYEPAAATVQSSNPLQDAIRQIFLDRKSGYRINQDERDAIVAYYRTANYAPLWLYEGKATERASALLKLLSEARLEGLDAQNYLPAGLPDFATPVESVSGDASIAARIDVGLTVAALTYARHIHSGQFDPNKLSLYNDLSPDVADASSIMRVLAHSPFPVAYLKGLEPSHPAYAILKAQLAKVVQDENQNNFVPFPATGKRVALGQRDDRIPELRLRMLELAFLDPGDAFVPSDQADLLDQLLSDSLKKFQLSASIKQTGKLDKATESALNKNPLGRERDQLMVNMERVRWLPRDLGQRYVFVNQASFEVVVKDQQREVWNSKVIVGRPLTQTYVFSDTLETVVFNPSWGVPQSILVNDYLQKLRRDPGYLDKLGLKVSTSSGQVVSSRDVNWRGFGNKIPLSVQQPPGGDNALGELKFLFPNAHDIYMHDTPTRHLFGESNRAFSHGCVRVENPRDFATVLLGWDRNKVDDMVDFGESTSVKIKTPYRVHLQYLTAWPDSTGAIKYYNDFYERDATMLKAMGRGSTGVDAIIIGDASRRKKIVAVD